MNELLSDLQAQMRAATDADRAPADLARRVRAGARRRQRRQLAGASGLALAAVGVSAGLLLLPAPAGVELSVPPASAPALLEPDPEEAPDDAAVRAADWWSYASTGEDGLQTRTWHGSDGSTVQHLGDGTTVSSGPGAAWQLPEGLLTWAQVRALPVDPGEVPQRLLAGTPVDRAGEEAAAGAFDGGLQVLATAPLDSAQRRALVRGLAALPGAALEQGAAGERLVRTHPDGTTTTARLTGDLRVVELVRPGAAPTTYTGWSVRAPEGFRLVPPGADRAG